MSWEAVIWGMQDPHSGAHSYFIGVPSIFEHILCQRIPFFVHLHFPIGGPEMCFPSLYFSKGCPVTLGTSD